MDDCSIALSCRRRSPRSASSSFPGFCSFSAFEALLHCLTPPTHSYIACDSDGNSEIVTNSDVISTISSLSSSSHFQPPSSSTIKSPSLSPFQPAIDKLWQLSFCRSPPEKLQILIAFQQSVIGCIDKHRQARQSWIDSEIASEQKEESSESESPSMAVSLCESGDEDVRTHGIVIESDDDNDDKQSIRNRNEGNIRSENIRSIVGDHSIHVVLPRNLIEPS